MDVIASNRSELGQDEAAATNVTQTEYAQPESEAVEEEDDFQFDENTFLDGADEE